MTDRELTIALERYDRHIPFFMGLARMPGFRLRPLEVGMVPPRRDGLDRHLRMLRGREFDVAEMSLATYIISKANGTDMIAVPIFPRRLFSQNHIFVNRRAGIRGPKDLIGRRVAIWAFQVTMSVLAKGDLQSEYGTPWREIQWVTQYPEDNSDVLAKGMKLEHMPKGRTGAEMLIAGEVDAYIDPHPPIEIFRSKDVVARLFDDPRGECLQYFKKYGYYPIMHVLVMREDLVKEFPHLPRALIDAWGAAEEQAQEFYLDHAYTVMPFGRYAYEEQQEAFGENLWRSGFSANSSNVDRFIGFLKDQQLLRESPRLEDLFHESTLET